MDMHTRFRHKFVRQLQGHSPEADGTRKVDTLIGAMAVILIIGALVADHKQFFIHFITKFLP